MANPARILVIVGSTRALRIGLDVAAWVAQLGRDAIGHNFELVDLRDWKLPMDDEPNIPAAGAVYAFEHTRAWSRKIAGAHGFVFVSPQYNWGYPAALKNALDHLYAEWRDKPAMIVTYGGHGGGKCAEQLHQVLGALHMRPVSIMPALGLSRAHIEANTGTIDAPVAFADHLATLSAAFIELGAGLMPERA